MMRARRIAGNIYKLLGNIVIDDVALVKSDNDAIKFWNMRLYHLYKLGRMEHYKRNI